MIFTLAMFIAQATDLGQNYPNPAKGKTYIEASFNSPKATLSIYNVLGSLIEERTLTNSGTYEINVTNYAEGVYLYTLDADGVKITKRMTVVRN
jgi:hypothetical protein